MKKLPLLAAAMLLGASSAFASIAENGATAAHVTQNDDPGLVVAQAQSIPIGRIGFNDRWRCQSIVDYKIYFATDTSETKARNTLLDYGLTYITCRYNRNYRR